MSMLLRTIFNVSLCIPILISCGKKQSSILSNTSRSTPPQSRCECVWEGPVNFTMTTACHAEKNVFLKGNILGQPCCAESWSKNVDIKIDLESGTTELAALSPKNCTNIEIDVANDIKTKIGDKLVTLKSRATDSILVTALKIGEIQPSLIDPEDPKKPSVAILIDVSQR